MEEIGISKFRDTCLAVLERVRETRQPVLVTRRGKPIAKIVPPPPLSQGKPFVGSMIGTGRIVGDIVSPAIEESEGAT